MKEDEVRKTAFAMPLTSPAYARPPFRFINREFIIVTYRTDLSQVDGEVVDDYLRVAPV
jgi:acetoacetate decarboxylase